MGWDGGVGGCVLPLLDASPGACGGEIDVDGGCGVGICGEGFVEVVTEGGDGFAEGDEARGEHGAGEVEGVAG